MNELHNIGTIKEILSRHGFTFSKGLGQNFLINPSVCPRMAKECGVDSESGVIEIGPGIGILTKELSKAAKKVVSIELDKRLLPVLDETLADCENVKIINDDVLKAPLKKIISDEFAGMDVYVCANLPYYITSPVIMRLLEEELPVKAITVMVQKEAAERICAQVGTRQCGAVTVGVNFYANPKMIFSVSPGSFLPAPKVESSVMRLELHNNPPVEHKYKSMFFKIVKAAFGQRRKTLLNALSSGLNSSKDDLKEAFVLADIPQNSRAEQLSIEEFAALARVLKE